MTLALGGLATLVLMPIAGFVTGRFVQPKWLILMAVVGMGVAMIGASRVDLAISFRNISELRVTQVVWLPFLFIPLSSVSYAGLPPDRSNEASALFNLMRNLGGSVGVSFVTTMLAERTQFHHERLAEHVTAYHGFSWDTPLAAINTAVQAQSAIMSYLDIFWLLGIMALVAAPAVLLLPYVPKGAAPAH
jgi:MFS transporter, DHA2 family, multidrug resistance protein